MMKRLSLVVMVIGLVLCQARDAHATSVTQLPISELIAQSGLVFRGTALEVDPAAYDPTVGPQTHVVFSVDEILLGSWKSDTIEFYVPGGLFPDGRFLEYVGAPAFEVGEKSLLFVQGGEWSITPVVNWWFGTFREVQVGNKTVFATQSGRAVQGLGNSGFIPGEPSVASSIRDLAHARLVATMAGTLSPRAAQAKQASANGQTPNLDSVPRSEELLAQLHQLLSKPEVLTAASGSSPRINSRFIPNLVTQVKAP